MDRHGLQGVGLIMLVSILTLVIFQHSDTLQRWTSFSASSSPSSLTVTSTQAASKLASDGLHHRTVTGEGKGRQLLQVATPAPAPGPASSDSGSFISYGALTAGYVPCPPQTGRSYYTANCQSSTAPVNPYTRGCSTISLCARS